MAVVAWYFVCECGAKWFSNDRHSECPRCRSIVASKSKEIVPWL